MKLLDKKDFLKSLNESVENQDGATAGAPGEGEEKEVVEIFTLKVVGSETGIENLRALVEYIKENGNTGHSFTITVDPDDAELKKDFGWDGDGADSIESVDVEIITDEIEDGEEEDGEEEAAGTEEDVNEAKKVVVISEMEPKDLVKALIKKNARFKWLKSDLPAEPTLKELKDILNKYGYGKELEELAAKK